MRLFFQYIKYCFTSKYRHGYGVHSPYVYHLITTIIEENLPYYKYSLVEGIREKLKRIDEKIGVFSNDGGKTLIKVKSLVNKYEVSPKFGQLLFRLVNFYNPEVIVEVGGTCWLSTMYMAAPNSKTPVLSLSMQTEMADLSTQYEHRFDLNNIKHLQCPTKSLVESYGQLASKIPNKDFLLIGDGVTGEDVLSIVQKRMSINDEEFFIIIPCPYATSSRWSAWTALKSDSRVKVAINIFQYGILIADQDLQKGDYILRY